MADGVAQLGSLDIVVANAGIGLMSSGASQEQAFRDQVEVSLFGVWNTVQAAAPVMIEQGTGGAIVLTGSTLGLAGQRRGPLRHRRRAPGRRRVHRQVGRHLP